MTELYCNYKDEYPVASEIGGELVYGKRSLMHIKKAISIFGGSKAKEDSWEYFQSYKLANELAKNNISIISGGGPGIMEAANKGTKEAQNEQAKAIGLNINIRAEKSEKIYQDISIYFEHFAARKIIFCSHSDAFIVAPGGFGTLDELFEVLTLMQTNKIKIVPIILLGNDFWGGLIDWLKQKALNNGLLLQEHFNLISIANDWQDVMSILKTNKII